MKIKFECGKREILVEVVFRKRKTLSIKVETSEMVKVVSPIGLSRDRILMILMKKERWIKEKIDMFESAELVHKKGSFEDGEQIMYLGRKYHLNIQMDSSVKNTLVKLYRGRFIVVVRDKNTSGIRFAMEEWYREKAQKIIQDRVNYYNKFFDVTPIGVKVKEQKRIWGSCTYQNRLLFNWRCIMAKIDVVDYIVVHEMCHMKQKDHSKRFWNIVRYILPDYKLREKWLRENELKMDL